MSIANDIADTMASRLNALAELSTVETVVDRQKNIASEITKRLAKVSGCCIVVLYTGFKNPDNSRSGRPVAVRTYTVTVYGRPVLQGAGAVPADEAAELAARCLHNWDPSDSDGFSEIDVAGCSMQPDKTFLVYSIDVNVTGIL